MGVEEDAGVFEVETDFYWVDQSLYIAVGGVGVDIVEEWGAKFGVDGAVYESGGGDNIEDFFELSLGEGGGGEVMWLNKEEV